MEDKLAVLDIHLNQIAWSEVPFQQLTRDRGFEQSLNCAAEWSRTKDRVVSFLNQVLFGSLGQGKADLLFAQTLDQFGNLQLNDLGQIIH
jgi:hypothetical protein